MEASMFLVGNEYTRDDIHAGFGGSKISYLPTVSGRIVAACLTRELNPQAPNVVLCGRGPIIERAGAILASQAEPIPVFLKRAPGRWAYFGRFRVSEAFTSGSKFASYVARSNRPPSEVTRVVLLSPTNEEVMVDPSLIVSGIAAVLQAAQTWIAVRDTRRAANAFEATFSRAASSPALLNAATQLATLAPPHVVAALGNRVQACWTKYVDILNAPSGSYLPQDIDDATEAVKACVCRELRRLRSVNGTLPPGQLSDWWSQYQCR
jgi:hypothetical protein